MATDLPLQCSLDAPGLAEQLARYEAVGRTVVDLQREPHRLTAHLRGADPATVEKLIEVERACCPFFELDWSEPVLTVASSEPAALDAIEYALHAG